MDGILSIAKLNMRAKNISHHSVIIHLVLISITNPNPFKISFKTQPISLGY